MTSRAGTTTRLEFTEEMRRVLGDASSRNANHDPVQLPWVNWHGRELMGWE